MAKAKSSNRVRSIPILTLEGGTIMEEVQGLLMFAPESIRVERLRAAEDEADHARKGWLELEAAWNGRPARRRAND